MSIECEKCRTSPSPLHIDATGSVVGKVVGKAVFCYAVIAEVKMPAREVVSIGNDPVKRTLIQPRYHAS